VAVVADAMAGFEFADTGEPLSNNLENNEEDKKVEV
jgi:hypothetical protein